MANERLIDTAAGWLTGDHLAAAGYDGASVWTSEARPGSGLTKPTQRSQVDSMRAENKAMFSNFQFGKPSPPFVSDYRHGFDGGVSQATNSLNTHLALGGPIDAPHYFSIDEDISLRDWNNLAVHWLRGIHTVLGVHRTGIYGSRRACEYGREDGVVTWFWQARGWRYEGYLDWAHIHQTAIDLFVPGIPFKVDTNLVIQPRFGAWHEYGGNFTSSEAVWKAILAEHIGH